MITINLKDGTTVDVCTDEYEQFSDLIREHMGDDAAELYDYQINELEEDICGLKHETDFLRRQADGARELLEDLRGDDDD